MVYELAGVLPIVKKNLRIYYMKGPVIIFGILLPIFFFLAFWMGRDMPELMLGTGLVAMALWFTSTSISPVIASWETRTKTLERLISSPVSVPVIVLGDILSSVIMGVILTAVPVTIAAVALSLPLAHLFALAVGILFGAVCFSAIGVIMGAYPSKATSDVMMLATLVKFPIVFISGIFIPVDELPAWGQTVAYLSPLTYLTDLINYGFGGPGDPLLDLGALAVFILLFTGLAVIMHKRTLPRRI
ncbi:MAG: ABC transporter permease [Methanomassiliicoccales archaeon]